MKGSAGQERILEAAGRCALRFTLGKTTIDDIAAEAGVSRATVYRTFPGGRDEIVAALVDWQVRRFLADLARHVEGAPDFETLLVDGLMYAHRKMLDHTLLQRVLDVEPDLVVSELVRSDREVHGDVARFLAGAMAGADVEPGVDVAEASGYLAHLVLSFIGNAGSWDLTDRAETTRLVRTQFLPGIVLQ
jgi:AcrR family transcriptional regulator